MKDVKMMGIIRQLGMLLLDFQSREGFVLKLNFAIDI
jgi:hypothetical protein